MVLRVSKQGTVDGQRLPGIVMPAGWGEAHENSTPSNGDSKWDNFLRRAPLNNGRASSSQKKTEQATEGSTFQSSSVKTVKRF